jgi:hypothetical protein
VCHTSALAIIVYPELGFAMSSRDKGEQTNDCGKKEGARKENLDYL